ncbi:hypothetical protein [Variovorax sp. Root473]|uniref:hypothetical protein n=1 Tax=Variovorax sp. Root473 TaxID=1736541 RepID=UPI001F2DDC7C|nr:hypothetical protein [Variovorax sp. Root473]
MTQGIEGLPGTRRGRSAYTFALQNQEQPMPMDFLGRIENQTFPLTVTDPVDIQNAAVLVAAGLVEANLPTESDGPELSGVVVRITPMGRAALKRMHDKPS